MDESEKSAALRRQEAHLLEASQERAFYTDCVASSKRIAAENDITMLDANTQNSRDVTFHYSFDFAQQVHYPSNPLQPGPIYFKTPRKCQLFGVNAEGLPQQINYMIDEAVACGKGANQVISMLHHFLERYGIGEMHLHLHADNCCGQNKNNAMLHYLCWRTLTGRHTTAKISFMLAGHTKFSCDWCFGLVKRLFRKTSVSCLDDISNVVRESTEKSGINVPQLVGDQSGQVLVRTYDWTTFLQTYFKPVVGVKLKHHFRFDANSPGIVFTKERVSSNEKQQTILKETIRQDTFPKQIIPPGFTQDRQRYLFEQIRVFCSDETKDLVCPKPNFME